MTSKAGRPSSKDSRVAPLDDRMPPSMIDVLAAVLFGGREARMFAPLEPGDLLRLAAAVGTVLVERKSGEARVALEPFSTEADASTLALIAIVNDDMPFLVDSVMAEIQARGIEARLVLHPILGVARDVRGRLVALEGIPRSPKDAAREEARRESLIVILLDRRAMEGAPGLAVALSGILAEVRAAVLDWQPMLARHDQAIAALERRAADGSGDLLRETIAFCRWLRDGQFTFLGMREYALDGDAETGDLAAVAGSGLGVLKNPAVQVLRRGRELVAMTPEVRRFFFAPQPIIITKSNVISRVHRRAHMDYIGLKTYGADDSLTGELRIVGLFTSKAYTERPRDIPFLRLKAAEAVKAFGFAPGSHDDKALAHILDTFPRDELFQIGLKQLIAFARAILDLELRPRTRVLVRADRFDRFVSALVFVPRDRFSTAAREKIGEMLAEAYEGRIVAFQPVFTSGPLVRVHFIVGRFEGPTPKVAEADLEARVRTLIRTWDDALETALDDAGMARLFPKYAHAFPAGYTGTFAATRALDDIARIERLGPEKPVAIDFYRDAESPANRVRAALYRFDQPIPLSERVPVFEHLGFRVIDERSYRLRPDMSEGRREVCLHDMILESAAGSDIDLALHDRRLEECYLAVARGAAESDPFNGLVLAAGAAWQECAVFRSYAAYSRQIRSPFGPRYIADTLLRHPGIARDLLEVFRVRFDPRSTLTMAGRALEQAQIGERFERVLAGVPSLDEDRILRHVLNLVLATVRTNFFRLDPSGLPPAVTAFKFASGDIEGLPYPRPFREIWVASPRVEGIHLRFAPIARGGIRWSDRAQDFRTEVLGLARAQQVKNTVIVPQGAKGGFFPKQMPRAGSREETQEEGLACYRAFIAALLDLTDNIEIGVVVPPRDVVRHDGDDPYLVVAADKGTATFSDTANGIATSHGFWLGDAFASGGSAGYDHKAMGITARGAWACVARHFREMGRDMGEPFTVVGVGDMSGDVFGNGMLLSPHIRLVAAFDHRDIFIDPDPEPAKSFAERRRLFELPRSSWQDYDKATLSKGGGVFSRSLKSVAVSREARAALGIDAVAVTPAGLIRAILRAPADLLWFGGIGSYVRASAETDDQAGDRVNDALRITAAEVRAKVVGESANLAVTQRGRIEFAMRGGRINTDFIDNSAGVNSSDLEVNIKIALGPAVVSGRLDVAARNTLLAAMTGDAGRACVATNHAQSLALSLAERESTANPGTYARLIEVLEARGLIDPRLEALPSAAEIAARGVAGKGLARPELAVVLAHAKIALTGDLLASGIPDDPSLDSRLLAYFPRALRDGFAPDLRSHKLRREIIATGLANAMLDQGGPPLAVRLAEDTGTGVAEVVLAYVSAERVFGLDVLWRGVDGLDGAISGARQLDLYAAIQKFLAERTAWFAREVRGSGTSGVPLDLYRSTTGTLIETGPELLTPPRRARFEARVAGLEAALAPPGLARRLALTEAFAEGPDIALAAKAADSSDIVTMARAFFAAGDALGVSDLVTTGAALNAADPYDRLAIGTALGALASNHRVLARHFATAEAGRPVDGHGWSDAGARELAQSLARLTSGGAMSASRLAVAAAELAAFAARCARPECTTPVR